MVTITFPDSSKKTFKEQITGMDVAKSIAEGLARAALAIRVDDKLQDLSLPIEKDAKVQIITFKDSEGVEVFRHSSAHLLAHAVRELFPKAKPTIGPVVAEGFYYDFDFRPFTPEDLETLEKKMQEIARQKLPIARKVLPEKEALKIFKDNQYKIEIIKSKDTEEVGQEITAYQQGDFIDLCRGPHVPHTGMLAAVKLTKLAGAYWRGDEKNPQLQRIYGISFPEKKLLKEYLERVEEAKKRDHRKLGKELDLFVFSELIGPGMPIYTPKGFHVRSQIIEYSRELNRKIGYKEVHTPNMNKAELFKISGHYDKYKDDMLMAKSHYSKEEYFLKPMNCPQHIQLFASRKRSYKELPIRFSDFANLYRDEKPGELSGLSRLRCFSQDDGHCFCTKEQIHDEFIKVLSVVKEALGTYGLQYHVRLSLWDPGKKENYLGDETTWEEAQDMLRRLLEEGDVKFIAAEGEAAFYGPKMDIMATDALQREWQISTIQLDLNMPGRFAITYVDDDGKEKTPIMIHRAIVGSPERFMAILIEHYAGRFPLWLSPNQVKIITVADRHNTYAQLVADRLSEAGILVETDFRSETIPKKVRESQIQQFNYSLVIGDSEEQNKTVNVRTRENVVVGEVKLDMFLQNLLSDIRDRK